MIQVPNVRLNSGVEIPQLGFGAFQVPPEETREVTLQAVEAGYRHIDAAQMDGNEQGVGEALAASGLARGDVFITSKLNNSFHEGEAARRPSNGAWRRWASTSWTCSSSTGRCPRSTATWRRGRCWRTSTGPGGFGPSGSRTSTRRTCSSSSKRRRSSPPSIAVEVGQYLGQKCAAGVLPRSRHRGCGLVAHRPRQGGGRPVIGTIAADVGRTTAQVALHWHVQRGDIAFPKSIRPERMRENFAIFDFILADAQMLTISALDARLRTGPNPDEFNWVGR